MYILWIILAVAFLLVEFGTVTLVSIWFVAGALAALGAYFLGAALNLCGKFPLIQDMPYPCEIKGIVYRGSRFLDLDKSSRDHLRKPCQRSPDISQLIAGLRAQILRPVARALLILGRGIYVYKGLPAYQRLCPGLCPGHR